MNNDTLTDIEGEIINKLSIWFPFISIDELIVVPATEDGYRIAINLVI